MGQSAEGVPKQDQWRIVQRNRRQRRVKETKGESNQQENSGTRFGVLASETDHAVQADDEGARSTDPVVAQEQVRGIQRSNLARASREKKKPALESVHSKKTESGGSRAMEMEVDRVEKEQRKTEKRSREKTLKDSRSRQILLLTYGGVNEGGTRGEERKVQLMEENKDDNSEGRSSFGPQTNGSGHTLMGQLLSNEMEIQDLDPGDHDNGPTTFNPEEQSKPIMDFDVEEVVPETQFTTGA